MTEIKTVEANGLVFGYLEAGSGPLALCLHGFPDSAHTWRHLLPRLADAGFRAVAPFMRGYAPTGVPADGAYQTGALAADANALHEALGGDGDAVIIGHDWGAAATYGAVGHAPERWRRAVAMAVPPLPALLTSFLAYEQLKRSFYMFLFQTPLAEAAVAADDMAFLDGLWADWSPGYDAGEDLGHVKDCLREPEHLAAAIGYYRAMFDASRHVAGVRRDRRRRPRRSASGRSCTSTATRTAASTRRMVARRGGVPPAGFAVRDRRRRRALPAPGEPRQVNAPHPGWLAERICDGHPLSPGTSPWQDRTRT